MNVFNGEAVPGGRRKRLFAFLLDAILVIGLAYVGYHLFGKPDFYTLKADMDAINAAGGADPELTNRVMAEFSSAYMILLSIAFVYESVTQILTGGSTIGKLICGLQVVPCDPERKPAMHALLLVVRSFLKMIAFLIFQGIPFLICCITIFTNAESRSGFDLAVKTRVIAKADKKG